MIRHVRRDPKQIVRHLVREVRDEAQTRLTYDTASPPANTTAPVVTGTPQDGQTLSASSGGWSGGPASYAYQWQRCDSTGAACADISGATAASYAAETADVDNTLRVMVTATNSGGSISRARVRDPIRERTERQPRTAE